MLNLNKCTKTKAQKIVTNRLYPTQVTRIPFTLSSKNCSRVCVPLCTNVVHNTAQNNADNFPLILQTIGLNVNVQKAVNVRKAIDFVLNKLTRH